MTSTVDARAHDDGTGPPLGADDTGSVFAGLVRRHPDLAPRTLPKRTLLAMSWAIEDEAEARGDRPVLVGAFQEVRHWEASRSRWRRFTRMAREVLVMADFEQHRAGEPDVVALPEGSALRREWIVSCEGPGLTATLVARELDGQRQRRERDRLFESVWTLDPRVVRDSLTLALEAARDLGSPAADHLSGRLPDLPLPEVAPPGAADALQSRIAAYTDVPADISPSTGSVPC